LSYRLLSVIIWTIVHTMSDYETAIVQFLGGEKMVGISDANEPLALHRLVLAGIPARCVVYFKTNSGLSNVFISHLLGVSEKTFSRWQEHPKKSIGAVASDRLLRSAKVIALAEGVLESRENARAWMSQPQAPLNNTVPQDLLTTDVGAQQVEDLLLKMEHGYLA
jgi:putative toxin-antitoxin system antitoxin component (TIGR02293 family)